MANHLSVRRVKVQTINPDGTPDGEPTFGVMAADDYEQQYHDCFFSLEELNEAIETAGSIVEVVGGFEMIDTSEVGTDNFYGAVELR